MAPIPFRNRLIFWILALGGAVFDLWTKSAIFARVGPPGSEPVSIIPNILELRTSYNTGALWGFGGNLPQSSLIFAVLSILACLLIVWWLFLQEAAKDTWLTVALGLIMAGAMGNCYDRLIYHHVRDFVYFHIDPLNFHCAIFNFADNMLVAGAVILMILALRAEHPSQETTAIEPAPAASAGT
ncbi:MAG: signal peptidase II [Isosphaeraceae bacterium]